MDRKLKEIKDFLRAYPGFFRFLYRLTTPVFGKSPRLILERVLADEKIINLGSGVLSIDPRVIDVDFYPYPNVKVVADAANLPFENDSIGGVICESLLEHVADPDAVIKEIKSQLLSVVPSVLDEQQIERLEECIKKRIKGEIDRKDFFASLDNSLSHGGVGLRREVALHLSRRMEILLVKFKDFA